MALDKGKENIEDEQQKKAVDGIIGVLDSILFSNDGRDSAEIALDRDHVCRYNAESAVIQPS